MPVQPIRLFGDPVLRTPAVPVTVFDKELRRLVSDLTDTMLEAPGAGLAAPQIGVGLRVFTFDVDDVTGHLVNPVLEFPDDEEQDGPEGCLSIPGVYVSVGWTCENGTVEVWVQDEGPGISNTANLFVPFFTTKPGGSGIGLVLCRQIAEAHGGSLTLEDRLDARGCVARLRLPLDGI